MLPTSKLLQAARTFAKCLGGAALISVLAGPQCIPIPTPEEHFSSASDGVLRDHNRNPIDRPVDGSIAELDPDEHVGAFVTEGDTLASTVRHEDGSFAPLHEVVTAPNPKHIKQADLNGDMKPDAAVLSADGIVGWHAFDSQSGQHGPFAQVDDLPADRVVCDMELGDFGGDQSTDLVVIARDESSPPSWSCELYSYINDGSGTFAPPVVTAVPAPHFMPQAFFAASVDADNDGLDDLALCAENAGFEFRDEVGLIMRCTGNGQFQIESEFESLPVTHDIAVGEITGDGVADVVLLGANFANQPRIRVYEGLGGGMFDTFDTLDFTGFDNGAGICVHDLDNANGDDIIFNRGDQLDLLVNQGEGFMSQPTTILGAAFIVAESPIDDDGDGVTDYLLALDRIEGTLKCFARVSHTGEPIRFAGESRLATASTFSPDDARIALARIDGDGDLDVCVLNDGGVVPYFNASSGQGGDFNFIMGPQVSVPGNKRSIAAADESAEPFQCVVAVLASDQIYAGFNHAAALTPILPVATGAVGEIAIVDMNGDGLNDVVAQSVEPFSIVVLLNQNDGSFTSVAMPKGMPVQGGTQIALSLGDFDGDQDLDIAYVRGTHYQVHIVLNDGDATSFTFAGSLEADFGQLTYGLVAGDFDGDRKDDLASAHYSPNPGSGIPAEVYIWKAASSPLAGGAAALFESPDRMVMELLPSDLEAADMDGDGDLDLLVALGRQIFGELKGVRMLRNDGQGQFESSPVVARTGGFPRDVKAGQLDGVNGPEVVVMSTNEFSSAFQGLSIHTNVVEEPLPPACPGDLDGNGTVNVIDLLSVIASWGACPAPPQPCPADIAPPGPPPGDGVVNVHDLLRLISLWGPC